MCVYSQVFRLQRSYKCPRFDVDSFQQNVAYVTGFQNAETVILALMLKPVQTMLHVWNKYTTADAEMDARIIQAGLLSH